MFIFYLTESQKSLVDVLTGHRHLNGSGISRSPYYYPNICSFCGKEIERVEHTCLAYICVREREMGASNDRQSGMKCSVSFIKRAGLILINFPSPIFFVPEY